MVAHVLNGLAVGGCEHLCLQLIKHSPPGIQHVLFNLNPARTEMREAFLACPGLTLFDRPYTRAHRLAFIAGMAADLRKVRANSVLALCFGVHLLVALSARAAGVTQVVTHAGNPPPHDARGRAVWRGIVAGSVGLAAPIASCSNAVEHELRSLAGVLPRGSRPIYNGIDIEAIASQAERTREHRQRDRKVIGMVARLNRIKAHDTLVRAFAVLAAARDDCELWLVGDGELRGELEALASELGVAERLRFLGERSDVPALLGQMDVLAFATTRDEGFGIALAEAMAAGVPIVATDVPACREVLGGGTAGKLVAPSDPQALAAGIAGLLDDPEAARAQAARALSWAEANFDIKRCAARYYELLLG